MPRIEKRKSSTLELPLTSRASAPSLFNGPTPPLTPSSAAEEFFARVRHFSKPGDPHSLVRSDAEAPEWGREQVYNQPRSRAGPLPSGSILDFAKVHEELQQQKLRGAKSKVRSPPPLRGSRVHSQDRGYENKTWTVEPALQGNGGLTNAMRAAADSGAMDISWIGRYIALFKIKTQLMQLLLRCITLECSYVIEPPADRP